jgi:hypothetical protein
MSDAEEKEYLREEAERLKGFYPPGHVSADDPAYGHQLNDPDPPSPADPSSPLPILNNPDPPPDPPPD